MSGVYVLDDAGASPVKLSEAKEHLRLHSDADEALVQLLVNVATEAAEDYTRRDFRANTWKLLLDEFDSDGICLRRDPVASVTSITHIVSGSPVTVAASTYYLKRGVVDSLILLAEDESWPTDTDVREQAIEVTFATMAHRRVESAKEAILRMVAHLYENRGDDAQLQRAGPGTSAVDLVRASGASAILDQFRVSRV